MGQDVQELVQCSLCNNEITKKSHPDTCKHLFCFECLKQWSDKHIWFSCPLCQIPYSCIIYFDDDIQEYEIFDLIRTRLDEFLDSVGRDLRDTNLS